VPRSVIIIGSGFAGLSAACFLAEAGWDVTVIEKQTTPGGRARQLKENGFTFDMGPSWYWMPDVFEKFFACFGKSPSDYYSLQRLDPSYRVYFEDNAIDVPADFNQLKLLFESLEPGSAVRLEKYLSEARFKYEAGMNRFVYKPARTITEFLDWDILKSLFRMDLFLSVKKHIQKHFSNPKLRQLMEFPVLFLGALPENTPALFSLMNYADMKGGTWYPRGGMYAVVQGMYRLATERGVTFHFGEEAREMVIEKNKARKLITDKNVYEAQVILSGADYYHTESVLLAKPWRSYSASYWQKKLLAPSCLMYYVGLNKKLQDVIHHSLFFDVPFERHAREIYSTPQWPGEPLFYLSVNSVSDKTVAPQGCESLVLLIPVASGLSGDDEETREKYFRKIMERLEKRTGQQIADAIICKKTFSVSDFEKEYHAFRGNAYGLANTLTQTAFFRPSCKSRKVKNLYYTGQLTVPGPGVPPCIISGEVAARQIIKDFG
jgi:phytoene desaturase